ncbi:ARMC2 protein, partial [Polypterus senegalus]
MLTLDQKAHRQEFAHENPDLLRENPIEFFSQMVTGNETLHARSFDLPDSRPVSAKRLSPLENKPQLPLAIENEIDTPLPLPKPPVDPVKIKKISNARARLFKAASQGALPTIMKPEESPYIITALTTVLKTLTLNFALTVQSHNTYTSDTFSQWFHQHYTLWVISASSFPSWATTDLRYLNLPTLFNTSSYRLQVLIVIKSHTMHPESIHSASLFSHFVMTTSQFSEDRNITGSEILTGSANGCKTNDGESESETQYWNSVIMPILQDLESLQNGVCAHAAAGDWWSNWCEIQLLLYLAMEAYKEELARENERKRNKLSREEKGKEEKKERRNRSDAP